MLEKPNLDDDAIVAALHEHHAIDVASIDFLPIGNDVGFYVYRVGMRAPEWMQASPHRNGQNSGAH